MNNYQRPVVLSLTILVLSLLLGSCASYQTNVPSERLKNNLYTSPDKVFSVPIPNKLIVPGIKINERKLESGYVVAFYDDFGKTYTVVYEDKEKSGNSVSKIAEKILVGQIIGGKYVYEKKFISTKHGQELRVLGKYMGMSPIASQTKENGKWVTKKLDLIQATSTFSHDNIIIVVSAGRTLLGSRTEKSIKRDVKVDLEEFLYHLSIK